MSKQERFQGNSSSNSFPLSYEKERVTLCVYILRVRVCPYVTMGVIVFMKSTLVL